MVRRNAGDSGPVAAAAAAAAAGAGPISDSFDDGQVELLAAKVRNCNLEMASITHTHTHTHSYTHIHQG